MSDSSTHPESGPPTSEGATPPKGPLERVLSVVTDVRYGEGPTALLLTLGIFLLFLAYYLLKPVREALILAMESGAEYKSYMSGAIAVGLLAAVPAYGAFAKRVARNRLVVGVTLFFASHLVLFYLGSYSETVRSYLGLGFYLWVGIFNMMVNAQAWAFAADIYTKEQGERLFVLIGVGASVGSATGSLIGVRLADTLGVYSMLLVAAGVLCAVAAITQLVHQREKDREIREVGAQPKGTEQGAKKPAKEKVAGSGEGAFAMVFRHRYLLLLAAFSLVFTLVNSNGEYLLSVLIKEHAEAVELAGDLPADMSRGDFIGKLFSEFYLYVNIAGAVLQLFVVSRLIKFVGLRTAFMILPVIALLDASLVAVIPLLAVLRIGKIIENSLDYSLNNTIRNMLWLPTTQEMKYRAKQAVDTFFVRLGDVGSALLVFAFNVVGLGLSWFAGLSAALAIVWIVIAIYVLRERTRLLKAQGIEEDGR